MISRTLNTVNPLAVSALPGFEPGMLFFTR